MNQGKQTNLRRRNMQYAILALFCLWTPWPANASSRPQAIEADKAASSQARLDVARIDRDRILRLANEALSTAPIALTHTKAKYSEGGLHDFYSNGDYWWPDPDKADGLPYVRRDGQSNPDNFSAHRLGLRQMRNAVTALAAGLST